MKCSFDSCDRDARSRGWCYKHYQRWYKHGDPGHEERPRRYPEGLLCSVEGCDRPAKARGWCDMHYTRWRSNGDPLISLNPRHEKGKPGGRYVDKDGYAQRYFPDHPNAARGSRMVAEHILIMSDHIGRALFPDETVHHVNGVRDQNNIENLELWSSSHPPGQRVSDKLAWAYEIIGRYA